jgi:hypothetical protein
MWTRPEDGAEILQNIRYTDEIAEHYGMSDDELARMDGELKHAGRYHIDAQTCIWPVR